MAPATAWLVRVSECRVRTRSGEVQLEFLSVLVGGHLRQARRAIRRADSLECFRVHRDSYGGYRGTGSASRTEAC